MPRPPVLSSHTVTACCPQSPASCRCPCSSAALMAGRCRACCCPLLPCRLPGRPHPLRAGPAAEQHPCWLSTSGMTCSNRRRASCWQVQPTWVGSWPVLATASPGISMMAGLAKANPRLHLALKHDIARHGHQVVCTPHLLQSALICKQDNGVSQCCRLSVPLRNQPHFRAISHM
jgi:hypothetical protein